MIAQNNDHLGVISQPPPLLLKVSTKTRFILSTSGRPNSLERYRILLQELIAPHIIGDLELAYLPYNHGKSIPCGTNNDGSVVYSKKVDPQEFIWAIRGLGCIGGAISKDIKQSVIQYIDELDDIASASRSVNTLILLPDGRIKGYNTDAIGFKIAIVNGIKNVSAPIERAVVYGYGGVTNIVVAVLSSLGISVSIAGRRMDEAAKKAAELSTFLGIQVSPWQEESTVADIFINAAPVTDQPLENALNFVSAIKHCKVAFDHELNGSYLKKYCEENSVYHISGLDMYYPQMIAQWTLFLKPYVDPIALENLPDFLSTADKMVLL
jgi:shikimate dehydrogenase